MEISLCMIVKNEEAVLGRCLDSVKELVDEIVIVDTGSIDSTREIAARYTEKVYGFEWIDDFAAARNYAFSKGTKEYLMWLDADDILENREEFLKLKAAADGSIDTYMLRYDVGFDENGSPIASFYRERIMRRCRHAVWEGAVHETVKPFGKIVRTDVAVSHRKMGRGDPDRNLRILEKQLHFGRNFGAREKFYYARELMWHGRYEEAEKYFNDFLSDKDGFLPNKIDACRDLSSCHAHTGKDSIEPLLLALTYGSPCSEICCDLGRYFFEKTDYKSAIFWYKNALENDASLSPCFQNPDCHGFLPCIQLCVCYYRLNDNETAKKYNDLAGEYKPNDKSYLFNLNFFNSVEK